MIYYLGSFRFGVLVFAECVKFSNEVLLYKCHTESHCAHDKTTFSSSSLLQQSTMGTAAPLTVMDSSPNTKILGILLILGVLDELC